MKIKISESGALAENGSGVAEKGKREKKLGGRPFFPRWGREERGECRGKMGDGGRWGRPSILSL